MKHYGGTGLYQHTEQNTGYSNAFEYHLPHFFFKLNANRVKLGQEVMLACAFYLEMSVSLVACLGLVQYKASGKRVYLSAL